MGRANNERMRSPSQERPDASRVASRADQNAVRSRQETGRSMASLAANFGPTGDVMAAKDVFTEGKKGNYGKAALAAASIIPGVGAIGDAARAADKAKDVAKALTPKVEKSVTAYMKKYGRDAAKAADEQIRKHGYNSQPSKREATHTKHWTEVADKIRKRMYNKGDD